MVKCQTELYKAYTEDGDFREWLNGEIFRATYGIFLADRSQCYTCGHGTAQGGGSSPHPTIIVLLTRRSPHYNVIPVEAQHNDTTRNQ